MIDSLSPFFLKAMLPQTSRSDQKPPVFDRQLALIQAAVAQQQNSGALQKSDPAEVSPENIGAKLLETYSQTLEKQKEIKDKEDEFQALMDAIDHSLGIQKSLPELLEALAALQA